MNRIRNRRSNQDKIKSSSSPSSPSSPISLSRACETVCEQLESRRLLSTIAWTNRSGSGLDTVFGGQANLARQNIDRAITDWQNVIGNFFYNDNSNTFNLRVETANL